MRHMQFIMTNFKSTHDITLWKDIRLFDDDSAIHVVVPRKPKEDGIPLSNYTATKRKRRKPSVAASEITSPNKYNTSQDSLNSHTNIDESVLNLSEITIPQDGDHTTTLKNIGK
jgi:hypothetical protein